MIISLIQTNSVRQKPASTIHDFSNLHPYTLPNLYKHYHNYTTTIIVLLLYCYSYTTTVTLQLIRGIKFSPFTSKTPLFVEQHRKRQRHREKEREGGATKGPKSGGSLGPPVGHDL